MNGISVTGRGDAAGTPDTLAVTIGVSVMRSRVSEAATVAAQRASDVIEGLRGLGIAPADVQTQSYSVGQEWDHRGKEPRILGYRVDNSLSITVRDVASAGVVLDAAIDAGGDDVRINGVTFGMADDAEMMTSARAAAWHDAVVKATQLADLAGVALGRPTLIEETVGHGPPPMLRAAAMDISPTTPIAPGEHSVAVSLAVTFAIEG